MDRSKIAHRFRAQQNYPGQATGMTLPQVQNKYTTCGKIYGQAINLSPGDNSRIHIDMPKDGRELLGISTYYNYANANENPRINLHINNTTFLNGVGSRALEVENVGSSLYFPLSLPLSGNDNITVDINNVNVNQTMTIYFYYS